MCQAKLSTLVEKATVYDKATGVWLVGSVVSSSGGPWKSGNGWWEHVLNVHERMKRSSSSIFESSKLIGPSGGSGAAQRLGQPQGADSEMLLTWSAYVFLVVAGN